MRRNGRIKMLVALLVGIVIGAAYVYNFGLDWPWRTDVWPGYQDEQSATIAPTPQPLPVPVSKPAPVAHASAQTDAGANCLRQQAAMLDAVRKNGLAKARAQIARWLSHRNITQAEADALSAHLTQKPDGDVSTSAQGFVRVFWTVKLGSRPDPFTFAYARKCACRESFTPVLPKPAVLPATHIALPPPPRNGCVEVSFNAPVGSKVEWIVGSIDGPMPHSQCDKQRQGNGPYHDWYDNHCPSWCIADMLAYIQGVIGKSAGVAVEHVYGASEEKQTIRFSTAIWTKSVGICIQYPDGSMHAVYIHPVGPGAWNHRTYVRIPDSFW